MGIEEKYKDVKSNSISSKEGSNPPKKEVSTPDKKIEKAIEGTAIIKKKSEFRKLMDMFFNEDWANIKTFVFTDVLVPTIQKAITDIVVNSIYMIVYPGGGKRYRSDYQGSNSRIAYDKNPSFSNARPNEPAQARTRTGFSYDDVLFETFADAKDALVSMDETMAKYRMVSVADFYDIAGISGSRCPDTYNNYGWTDIHLADVVRAWNGKWTIKLPRPLPFD